MKLSDLSADSRGRVTSLPGDKRFINRISAIGITSGVDFRVIKNDKHMPVLIYVRQTLLALNRRDCERIEVEVAS
ncbi:MAG: ferrous iron transport protein A [Clostridiales bacterium]|nr:ferrous iron transport protein A [Clostridiales bacterium]